MDPTVLEATKLAVGLAKDLSVQLLTLSSALIGLTVVLIKDVKKSHNGAELILAVLVLFTYIVSIVFGIYAIMKLIGSLAPVSGPVVLGVDAARPAAGWQIIAFVVATGLFSVYGVVALVSFWWKGGLTTPSATAPPPAPPDPPIKTGS
ncbi:hypothetical protein [Bradyrhizobium sp. OK095]|uniref:hypothetical protein n=1 Tax=Bradyrhizobium sp. OK095 TaxID=1882760 RepID=UPI0008C47D5D|nr:hypothetical protein [Bradyrhizobium sp. OK095]SEN41014.1 hypothetical protein SAMN05443254_10898 [Bradyrhizobium sp. OK095]